MAPTDLPIEPVIPALRQILETSVNVVLQAPPGAGKTTRVPLALLDATWLAGRRLIVLEPRRLAARAAARRMADLLGESVGETVGYRMRLDTKVSARTRIEVVTDGVFVRQLQSDPELTGVGLVAFDEIHERSLDSDLNLALCLEVQGALRRDLRLIAMSATLDGAAVARLLGDAPVLTSEGRSFPVETIHLERPAPGALEDAVAATVRRALAETGGDILVFLPGAAEIRRVAQRLDDLGDGGVRVAPLYGDLPQAEQDAAILPDPSGRRRVVLATAIAETSLTIEGVTVVIDSGLMRLPRFEPRSGMTGLETVRVSQAASDQRRGRAGRLGPGRCYRLWPEAEQRALLAFTPPEMRAADLAPLALELACWGAEPGALAWLDPPPDAAFEQGRALLAGLGALDPGGRITAHGRAIARFGVHPRLAHMMLAGHALGHGRLAAILAAVLGERDVVKARPGARDADLRLRAELVDGAFDRRDLPAGLTVERGALQRARQAARRWQRALGAPDAPIDARHAGLLIALAYPDRIAQRRGGRSGAGSGGGQFVLSNGRGAALPATEPLAAEDFLAVADLDAGRQDAQIFRAAPLALDDIERAFADRITVEDRVAWDARDAAVLARRQRRLGRLVLKDEPLAAPPRAAVTAALLDGIRAAGPGVLPWRKELAQWRARVAFARRLDIPPGDWPDLSDDALVADLENWLAPFLDGVTRLAQLKTVDLDAALRAQLDWAHRKALDDAAPTHVVVPSGSRLPIDYEAGDTPVLAVRLQEMFGLAATPAVAGGRVPLLLHLLSPASRPVQVTRDLASFWATGYRAVKSDLKGQYPKHYWPDDPLQAQPTNRTKKRMGQS
ncbi:MAG TPA: ATP-dependent helicase HrpB [Candidatus Sulfotelmatobacter sp.]|nr:ATP-dependent helicase HrpB [Candidatus Sulfotelmatobacter sp.]